MNIIENLVKTASQVAYDEGDEMVVGRDNSGQWVYRHIEDPESQFLADNFVVCADGVHPDYRDYYARLIPDKPRRTAYWRT